jgi:amino acid permease
MKKTQPEEVIISNFLICFFHKFISIVNEESQPEGQSSAEVNTENQTATVIQSVAEPVKQHKDSLFKTISNIMFLGLGTSALAICKVPYHISIIMTPVCIVLGGIANIWSYHILGDLYERYKINNYEHLTLKICGKKMTLFLVITLNIYTVGLLLIHQVLIFRLLGGIINVIGGYDYESMLTFLSDTYWSEIWVKLCVNFGIGILIIFPLCLISNMKILNISSTVGVFTTLFIFLVVLVQFPFYFIEYLDKEYKAEDEHTHINIYHVERGFTSQLQFLQAFALFFFCFTGHNGLLPALEHLENPSPARRAKLYNIAIAMDMIIYLVIAICGYLSVPVDVVDIVFERKRIWTHDVVMTIARILLIPMAISKIQVNHNIWRISFVSYLGNDHTKITMKFNLLFTGITLFLTTLISSVYQNIVGYISLIGCFCVVFPAFLIPPILYMYTCGLPKTHWKVISQIVLGAVLCTIGYISGILGLIDIINGDK